MPAGDQVTMLAQHRLRAHQQPDPAQYVAGQTVHQRGKQRPISPGQPNLLPVQLPFENRDLVPSARISASLSRSLIGSSRSRASALVTPR